MSDQRLLSTGDVARMLHVSDATVKRWADSGALRCLRTVGTHRKFLQSDVAALLASVHFVRPKPGAPVSRTETEEAAGHLTVGDTKWLHGALSGPADVAGDRLLPAFELLDERAPADGSRADWRGEIAIDCLARVCAVKGSAYPQTGAGRVLCIRGRCLHARAMALLAGLVAREAGFTVFNVSSTYAVGECSGFLKIDCVVSTIDVPEEAIALDGFVGTLIEAGEAFRDGHSAPTLAELKHLLSPTLRRGTKDGADG